MTTPRRYTRQFKTDAITRLREAGFPNHRGALTKVASELGLPPATLKYWFQNPSQPLRGRRPALPASIVETLTQPAATIDSTISTPSAPSPGASDPRRLENSTTIDESSTIAIAEIDLPDLIAFYSAELAHIRAILHASRDTASYKDLLTAHRVLTADIDTLKTRHQHAQVSTENAFQTLLELMERFASEPSPTQTSETVDNDL